MELLQRLLFTAVSAAAIIYFIIKIRLAYWKNRGILHKKPKFFYGNLKGVGKKRHIFEAIQEVYDAFKETDAPFVGFYTFIRPTVLITKLELMQLILQNDSNKFEIEDFYHSIRLKPLTVDGMGIKDSHTNNSNTRLSKQSYVIFPLLVNVADNFQLAMKLRNKQTNFNINELVDCFNVDVIASLVLGLESNSLKYPENEFRMLSQHYPKRRMPQYELLSITYPYLAEMFNYKGFDIMQAEYFWKLLKAKKEQRYNGERHLDLLTELLDIMEQKKRTDQLSEQAVASKAFSLVFSNLERLNAALSFCLYELAVNPKVQETLRSEITEVLNRNNGKLSPECLAEMKYLQLVLKENQRLHPVTTFLVYTSNKDFEVPNTVFMLQANNRLIIPTMAVHRDPLIFDDPLKFNPDRFLTDNLQKTKSFVPFSYGWHSFIDANFAQMQLSVGLITILRHYRLSPCSETETPLKYDPQRVSLCNKSDIKLTFERIES